MHLHYDKQLESLKTDLLHQAAEKFVSVGYENYEIRALTYWNAGTKALTLRFQFGDSKI